MLDRLLTVAEREHLRSRHDAVLSLRERPDP
jgi:hypothetical protein